MSCEYCHRSIHRCTCSDLSPTEELSLAKSAAADLERQLDHERTLRKSELRKKLDEVGAEVAADRIAAFLENCEAEQRAWTYEQWQEFVEGYEEDLGKARAVSDERKKECERLLAQMRHERLRNEAENARLRAALVPYADLGNWVGNREPYWNGPNLDAPWLVAQAALRAPEPPP